MPASLYTPEAVEKFVSELAETGQVKKACEAAGITRRVAYYWRYQHAEFGLAWKNAMKIAVSVLEDEAHRRAHDGVEEPIYHLGKCVGTVHKYSDTLLIFLLKGADPNKYRDRVALTGEDGGPMQTEVVIRKMFVPLGEDGSE